MFSTILITNCSCRRTNRCYNLCRTSQIDVNWNTRRELTLEGLLKYEKSFGNHNLNVLAGYSQIESKYEFVAAYRDQFPTNELYELNAGSSENQKKLGEHRNGDLFRILAASSMIIWGNIFLRATSVMMDLPVSMRETNLEFSHLSLPDGVYRKNRSLKIKLALQFKTSCIMG